MPGDPLEALRKAQSIQSAPPDRGWLSADAPHPYLGAARDVLKGLTGIGDQGPGGVTATNIGQLLGAAIPFTGLPKVRSLSGASTMVDDALEGLGHTFRPGPVPIAVPESTPPYAKAFFNHMNEATPDLPNAADKFLSERQNPYYTHPQGNIQAPEGFKFAGSYNNTPQNSMPSTRPEELNTLYQQQQDALARFRPTPQAPVPTMRSIEDLQFIQPPANQKPSPPLSGKWGRTKGSDTNMGTSTLSEQQVKLIRAHAQNGVDPRKIAEYYDLALPTVKDIIRRNSFSRIK